MNSLLKWITIAALIIVGLGVLRYIMLPALGLAVAVIWGLSGILAVILKLLFFLALLVAFVVGIIMLVSWIIREVSY